MIYNLNIPIIYYYSGGLIKHSPGFVMIIIFFYSLHIALLLEIGSFIGYISGKGVTKFSVINAK